MLPASDFETSWSGSARVMLEALFPQPVVLATKLGISLKAGTTYDGLSYFNRVLYPEMQSCTVNPSLRPSFEKAYVAFRAESAPH